MILRRIILPVLAIVVLSAITAWYWLLHTEHGARFAWQRVVSASDGALAAQTIAGDFSTGVRLTQTRFVDDTAQVTVESLLLAVDVDLLPLTVQVETLRADTVAIRLIEGQGVPDEKNTTTSPVPDIALPLQLIADGVQVNDIRIFTAGDEPRIVFDRVAFAVDWKEQLQVSALEIGVAEPQLTIVGEAGGTAEKLDIVLSVPAYGAYLAASVRDLQVADITSLEVDYSDVQANGQAIVNWADELSVVGEMTVARANIAAFNDSWPEKHPVAAELAIEYSNARIAVGESQLQVLGTDTVIETNGILDLESGRVDAVVNWTQVQWPLAVAEPRVRSDSGEFNVQGTPDDWQVDGTMRLAASGVDDGTVRVAGFGDSGSLSMNIVEGRVLGGSFSGDVSWSWLTDDAWAAALDMSSIQLAPLLPELPATLSGHVDVAPEKVVAKDLSLVRENDRAVLNGDLISTSGLAFELLVDDIGFYVPSGAGAVNATGTLSLVNEDPYLRINGSSDWLAYDGIEVFDLRVQDLNSEDEALAANVSATEVLVAGEKIRDIATTLRVARERQEVDLSFALRDVRVAAALAGQFDHWDSPEEWRGTLNKLDVGIRDFDPVTIDAPAEVFLASDRIELAELCLRARSDAGACARFAWEAEQRLDLSASFERLPVELVNDFVDSEFSFEQVLSGSLQWHHTAGARPTGSASVHISAGRIRSVEMPDFDVVTEEGGLAFEIVNGKLLAGDLWLPMPGTGDIRGHFEATDVAAALDSPINGSIDANITDIGIAAVFSPLIDRAAGELVADIEVSGTLAEPRALGILTLDDGQLSYGPLGLVLNDIEVDAEFDEERQILVNGSFRAGEGKAEFQTSTAYAATDATGIQMRLRGDNLTLIDVPDVRAVANADLSLKYEANALHLDGSLDFPSARIVPNNLGAASATESEDVVIVAGELPDTDIERSDPLDIFGELSVTLGPDVVVDLGVAQAIVTGQTRFNWSGDVVPVANGRYDISGDIRAFGQVLEITEGGIRFENVAANDPHVRIRAERQIYGNSQVKRAGVLVDGRLPRPSIGAYTEPVTTEERALALLVTGSDFDFESGTGAIDFGTYIAPRLFVSYGVGIFERDNIISARYDLKRGFGIKVTSGQTDSGVDLTYIYEN